VLLSLSRLCYLWTASGVRRPRRRRGLLLAAVSLVAVLVQALWGGEIVYASTPLSTAGYLDFSYSGTTVADPTGEKPESKLWWNDGFWWGSLYQSAAGEYRIFRLNWGTQTWEDTGVALDDREDSKADAHWDAANNKLYVASHVFTGSSASTSALANKGRLYRYSYDPATQSYSLDADFPVIVNNDETEALVLDKDSGGRLWITYVSQPGGGNHQVYMNTSAGPGLANDAIWGTPFSLGTLFPEAHVDSDDIASLIAFRDNGGQKIGIMWSNHLTWNVSFATHDDSNSSYTAALDWSLTTVPIPVTPAADDHINIKSLQTTSSGQVFAAIKTSASNSADPLIGMVTRDIDGALSFHTYSTKADGNTRPILLIDEGNLGLATDDRVYLFVTDLETGGRICYKTAVITTPLSAMSFPPGACGTVFMADAAIDRINNSTSTKQNVNSATGVAVLASDESNGKFYVHNVLGDPLPVITAHFPGFNAANVPVNAVVSVTFSKPMDASTLTTTNFIVVNSDGPVAGAITYAGATRTATFTPDTLLRANTPYTVTVSSGVRDSSHQPLYASASNVWSFTTETPTAQFSGAAYSVSEGAAAATITTTLNTSSTTSVMINYATTLGGTATAGEDYTAASGTLTFDPGQISRSFTVPITNEDLIEPNETVNLALSLPVSATLGSPITSTLTIVDDDGNRTVQYDLGAISANEGDGGKAINVTLSSPSVVTLTVDYETTLSGTATAGQDYIAIPTTTLTFAPLQTSRTFTVTLPDDALDEAGETVLLALSNPSPGISVTLGAPSVATLTLVDDDLPPDVRFSAGDYWVNEAGGAAVITATLSAPSAFTVTVSYETSDGTATAGNDYLTATGTLTFTPGLTGQAFVVSIMPDQLAESNETVELRLSNASLASLGIPNAALLTIVEGEHRVYLPLVQRSP